MANVQWAPDHSQFIDLDKYPGAFWDAGDPGTAPDTVQRAPGFYTDATRRQVEDGQAVSLWRDGGLGRGVGAYPAMQVGMWTADNGEGGTVPDNTPNYQRLKEAGLWDLSDPNSPTWQFLNSQAGGRDVRSDPTALFQALNKVNPAPIGGLTNRDGTWTGRPEARQAYESHLRGMLTGLPAQFVDSFIPAAVGAQEQYSNSIDDSTTFRDTLKDFASLFTEAPPLMAALAAFTGGASLAAGGTAAGSAALAGGVTGGVRGLSQEGDLMDGLRGALGGAVTGGAAGYAGGALSDFLGTGTTGGVMPDVSALGGGAAPAAAGATLSDLLPASGGGTVPAATMPPAVPPTDPTFGGVLTQTGAGQFENLANTGAFGAGLGATATAATGIGGDVAPPGSPPSAPAATAPASSGGALSRLLDGTATQADWLSVLGNVGATGLSMFGLNQQQDSLNNIASQQMAAEQARYNDLVAREQERFGTLLGREDAAIGRQRADIDFGRAQGAPYRDQLAGLMADPNSFLTSQAVQAPLQQGTNALARSLSVNGNPAGRPGAMAEIQKYASNSLASLLGQEKDRLATFGGLSAFNQAGATVPGISSSLPGSATAGSNVGTQGGLAALMGGAQAGAQQWGDLGRGLRNIFSLV